ncbi:MAG: hypothetical protein ACKVVT_01865 [Dehalococcoidia bacterium]
MGAIAERLGIEIDGIGDRERVPALAEVEALWEAHAELRRDMERLLKGVGQSGTCSACSAPIFWLLTKNHRAIPYTLAGKPHFADCPKADQMRRRAR